MKKIIFCILYLFFFSTVFATAAEFDIGSNILTISSVKIGNSTVYDVRLQLTNNGEFIILDYSSEMSIDNKIEAEFDIGSNILTISSVKIGNSTVYDLRLQLTNSGNFIILDYSPEMPIIDNEVNTGIHVSGTGQNSYEVYDATGGNFLAKANTNQTLALPQGTYSLKLHGTSLAVTVLTNQVLTIYTGGVTFSGSENNDTPGSEVNDVQVYDETGEEHLTDVKPEHEVDLFPNKYTLKVNDKFVPVTVLATVQIKVDDKGEIIIPDPPSSSPVSGAPVSGGRNNDVIVVNCDGTTTPSYDDIMNCVENKLKDIEETGQQIIRDAIVNSLKNVAVTHVGMVSNLATVLTNGYSFYDMANHTVPESTRKLFEDYMYLMNGCGLPFGHAVICN